MRLVDEIVNNSAYLDFGMDQIEYVALSYESLEVIKKEVFEELQKEYLSAEDIDDALAMKHLVMPSMKGIDYRFLKEIKFE
jgi:hypothetical protein